MYLAGELFRYAAAVTRSDEALGNCYESFEAMERLNEITRWKVFPPARSTAGLSGGRQAALATGGGDEHWVWKATTCSEEIVGHFFVYAIFAEIVQDKSGATGPWR
jgi:hypothetical protein